MLYSAHFSFDEIKQDNTQRHGYFTCVVSAGSPELALQKFKQRILTIKDELNDPLFKDIKAVYVEDIVEISDTPDDPVVTRFQSSSGPYPKTRSCNIPTSDTRKIKAYEWIPDAGQAADQPESDSDGEYKEAVPFISF